MTRYMAVPLLLFVLTTSQPTYAAEEKFCKGADDLIAEIKTDIEEEEKKHPIDAEYLRALWIRLEGVLEARIVCLEGMLEIYRQSAGDLDEDCDGNS
jgi:hypothetical protein